MTHALTFPTLKRLSNGEFQSGEALAKHFNVSRATIWNAIQDAQTLGIEVFSVRGRGYKLPNAFDWLSVEAILHATQQEKFTQPFTLEVHDTLPSTNSDLMQKLSAGQAQLTCVQPTCVATNFQTAGRGRRGRNWQAGLGASLTFSVFWRFQCGASALSGLSLAVGVALIRAFKKMGVPQAKLKWPNDIVVKNQTTIEKLAGILIELQGDMEGPTSAVIGIGINLNLPDQIKNKIDQPATDLTILQSKFNANSLLASVLHELANVLNQFEQQGFTSLRDEWISHHAYQDEMVKMLHPNGSETIGKVSNVAEDGVLLVATEAGVQRFSSGEISLRGIA